MRLAKLVVEVESNGKVPSSLKNWTNEKPSTSKVLEKKNRGKGVLLLEPLNVCCVMVDQGSSCDIMISSM